MDKYFVLHSTTVNNLCSCYWIGGLPAPSLAVVKEGFDMDYFMYGDTFLLMKPEVLCGSEIYKGDGDTPVFPQIYRKQDVDMTFQMSDEYGFDFDNLLVKNDYCEESVVNDVYRFLIEHGQKNPNISLSWETSYIVDSIMYQRKYVPKVPFDEIHEYVKNDAPFEQYMAEYSAESVLQSMILEREKYPPDPEIIIHSKDEFDAALLTLDTDEHNYLEAKPYSIIPFDMVEAIYVPKPLSVIKNKKVVEYHELDPDDDYYSDNERFGDFLKKMKEDIPVISFSSANDIPALFENSLDDVVKKAEKENEKNHFEKKIENEYDKNKEER